uniref:Retrotransposon Copia-like N-terminal domain-containing protein n=1 Tax=Cajanus cajan TaxID=3821 RepID=A0A151T8F5_CAJCA|nr:hypothetical protein KK1_017908 [Cajanus cajan]
MADPIAEVVNNASQNTREQLQNLNTAYRLNGKNYLKWAQLVRRTLKGKGKANHLTEDAPKEEDPKFTKWDEEDSMIMARLWNSMIPEKFIIIMNSQMNSPEIGSHWTIKSLRSNKVIKL